METVSQLVYEMQSAARALEIAAYQQKLPRNFVLQVLQRQIIVAALERNKGNQSKAARVLGCHRNTLTKWMIALKLDWRKIREQARQA